MKDSVKANLIIFFIIAIIAFGVSTSFAKLTVKEDTDSYKLIPIENNSFKPNYIDEVPTIIEKANTTNTTNSTFNMTDNNSTLYNETDDNYTNDENSHEYNYTNYIDYATRDYSER